MDRAGALLSAAAVTAALAAGLATGDGRTLTAFGVAGALAAAVGFVAIVVAGVAIWRPISGTFTFDAGALVGSYADGPEPATLSEMHRELALYLGRYGQANRVRLDTRLRWYSAALVGFLIEVAGLVCVLADLAR